jgi:outer membrane protein, heavy metal efflux system
MNLLLPGTATAAMISAVLLAGCASGPGTAEKQARSEVDRVGGELGVAGFGAVGRPGATTPATELPVLTPNSAESDYIRFALLNHPAVRAAYFDWRASVAAIAPARALPDPQFTFQADIASMVTSFMPGLMFDIMAWEKRAAMGREATAASEVAYREYVATVLKTAAGVRKAWIELAYAEDTHRLYTQTIHAAEQAAALAGAEYQTASGMVNFEQQVRFQNLLAEHHAHHASVADRITAARAKFKAALGLLPTDADPTWPSATLRASSIPPESELWSRLTANNADLAKMRGMVDMAVAGIEVAKQSGTPDFSVGGMVDLKASPLMFRPTATATLPIWRDKIRGTIEAAEARRDAATARVSAEQLEMAAQLAQMLYMVHEADHMLAYIDQTALPNLERTLGSAEATAESGMGGSTMVAEAQIMAIDMRHERLDALRDRENAVVDLALMIADVAPAGGPLLAGSSQVSRAK